MSINTTVKVGFDGTAVKTGLKNIGGMFGKFSKEVGIGAARKVGEFGTDWVGKSIQFLVEGATAIFDFAGELKDLSALTGESAQELMILNEQLKLAGADSGESGKQLLTFSKAIYESVEAAKKGEKDDVWNIFSDLGLTLADLMRMKPAAQIEAIFSAMSANNVPKDKANAYIEKLFGGTKGLLKYGKVFADGMAESRQTAINNLGPLLKMTDKYIAGLEAAGDEAERFKLAQLQLSSAFAKGLTGGNTGQIVAGSLKGIFDGVGKAAEWLERAGATLRNTFEYIGQVGFGKVFDDLKAGFVGWAEDIGARIGQAIKNAIKSLVAGTPLQSMFEPSPVAFAGPPSNLANTMKKQEERKPEWAFGYNPPEGYNEAILNVLKLIYKTNVNPIYFK
jgi:hypothetical protein